MQEIWDKLNAAGIPDEVVDHRSEEFKAIRHKLYIQKWIGDVACHCCALSCMSKPPPKNCPFCGCPTSIDFDKDGKAGDLVLELTVTDEFDNLIDNLSSDAASEKAPSALDSSNNNSNGGGSKEGQRREKGKRQK